VVIQEALLLGRGACGSDISTDMVSAAEQNIEWLQTQVARTFLYCQIHQADATEVELPDGPLAIVSEGFLGPNQTSRPDQKAYETLKSDLGNLYSRALQNWAGQLPAGAEVTITMPYWHTQDGWRGLDIIDRLPDLGYTLRVLKHVDSRQLVYRRPDQLVGRQLLLLRKS
jgi:tRNA G10  N-methylase Trm11